MRFFAVEQYLALVNHPSSSSEIVKDNEEALLLLRQCDNDVCEVSGYGLKPKFTFDFLQVTVLNVTFVALYRYSIFELAFLNQRTDMLVKAYALQSVGLGSLSMSSITQDFKSVRHSFHAWRSAR